jgi:hypothetical protein
MSSSDKPESTKQYENAPSSHSDVNSGVHEFTAEETPMKKGYFRTSFFLRTMLATGLGLAAAVGGFGFAASNLALINADVGPGLNITWVLVGVYAHTSDRSALGGTVKWSVWSMSKLEPPSSGTLCALSPTALVL